MFIVSVRMLIQLVIRPFLAVGRKLALGFMGRYDFSRLRAITNEWGEKSDPEPVPASKPNLPKEDDEWGKDSSPSAKITDEWGEKSNLDPEAALEPDPPRDEDDWGKEVSLGFES
ncbi:uncharacterized protein A4U43_C02F13770 [Asparagus officinalis]|uniref:Uncharacterized protein n=1 Tax=Asparagus officinalis TaxID=4686 RepID=A0A5P1FIB6_ASPOF|nr:uncharacterized protein A4U43_C02F13770 [Asparagus officinalis]